MRLTVRRLALPAIFAALLIGCGVTHADIDHWKRTQRGPGKIAAVLVGTKYPRDLRVHAARALIEMHHPNYNGLELLTQAMTAMAPPDREEIIHDLLPSLEAQMRGTEQQQTSSGPAEAQIKAKDAAYLLLRFASSTDRSELSNVLLGWLLADLNTRALAGQYTAEQIVQAIGPSATDRLSQAFTSGDDSIRVAINIAQLINSVGTDPGKDAAATRLVAVSREVSGPAMNDRLRTAATQLLTRDSPNTPVPPDRLAHATEQLRGQYLNILFEALRILSRPVGTQYFISVAADPSAPLDRRKAVLAAVAGQVHASDTDSLLAIATTATGPTDVELRGLAVDRVGETRNVGALPRLWEVFDTTNGGEDNNEYTLRWKAGEAILKLGLVPIIPTFVQHMSAERRPGPARPGAPPPATFTGYTYAEINGYALSIGDFAPPPRDAMRGLLSNQNAYIRAMALLFLGAKGEAADLPRIDGLMNDAAPLGGPGWSQAQATNVAAVAVRARDQLRHSLNMPALPLPTTGPAAAGLAPPAAAPAAPAPAAPAAAPAAPPPAAAPPAAPAPAPAPAPPPRRGRHGH